MATIRITVCARRGSRKLAETQQTFEKPIRVDAKKGEVWDTARYYCRCWMSENFPAFNIKSYAMTGLIHWT